MFPFEIHFKNTRTEKQYSEILYAGNYGECRRLFFARKRGRFRDLIEIMSIKVNEFMEAFNKKLVQNLVEEFNAI